MKITTISEQIGKGRQSIDAERIMRLENEARAVKVRIKIKSDSYDFQSYARAEVFDQAALKWNQVASIHYSKMSTPSKLAYVKPTCNFSVFERDIQKLLDETIAIVMD